MNSIMISGSVKMANGSFFLMQVDDSYGTTERFWWVKVLFTPTATAPMPEVGQTVLVQGDMLAAAMVKGQNSELAVNHVLGRQVHQVPDGTRVNQVNVIGNIVRDAKVFPDNPSGPYGLVTIAVNLTKEDAIFPGVSFSNGTMAVAPYLNKGQKVGVTGVLQEARSSTDQQGRVWVNTNIRGFRIDLCGGPRSEQQQQAQEEEVNPEDIPF